MKDPYEVLGVSRTASDSEIKRAYHELVKKYHPDNYADNPLADLASEKMKEINEAYDSITKSRASGGRSDSGYGYSGSGYGSSGYNSGYNSGYSSASAGQYSQIRGYINYNQLDQAEALLNGMANRDAEWYFLKGQIAYRKGWLDEARQNFQTAAAMNPNNGEYQQSLRTVSGTYSPYRQTTYQNSGMDEACNLCNALLCLNCLCGGCR